MNVFTSSASASALDCCETCQEATDCESFAYYEESTCYLLQRPSGNCSATLSTASQSGGAGFYYHSNGGDGVFVVGNGACGYLFNGGAVG